MDLSTGRGSHTHSAREQKGSGLPHEPHTECYTALQVSGAAGGAESRAVAAALQPLVAT